MPRTNATVSCPDSASMCFLMIWGSKVRAPDSDLGNTMLNAVIDTVADTASKPVIHSDRGAHYR